MDSMTVDGASIKEVVTPGSAAELASVLGEASASGRAVTPIGSGTKLAVGNVPAFVDLGLSTGHLTRVLHYEPTDMTLSVEAGIRFGELQVLLAERGQALPIEVPDDAQATIGGLIATAMAGPRRLGCGTLRDLLIGISVAYPSGILAKAGGLVVKNVTGFDLMRLHLGAFGTLGVITSANFKVLPLARTETTLITSGLTLDEALSAASTARQSRLRPISVEVFSSNGKWQSAVRLEGRAETVALGASAITSNPVWSTELSGPESAQWWRTYVQQQSLIENGDDIVVRFASAPKKSGTLSQSVQALLSKHALSPQLFAISPGLGTVLIQFNSEGLSPDSIKIFQSAATIIADTVTVLKAPADLKAGIDIWGAVPTTVAVMRSLKSEFDGGGTLNPGRFVDRI